MCRHGRAAVPIRDDHEETLLPQIFVSTFQQDVAQRTFSVSLAEVVDLSAVAAEQTLELVQRLGVEDSTFISGVEDF